MTIVLRAHRNCNTRRQIQRMLHLLGVPYDIKIEREGELGPPALFVDGELVSRELPTMHQLMSWVSPLQRAF